MLTCDRCRAALLDRHYGLLDAAEAAAVVAHLAGCPACQAEQMRVERFGRLLSAAARTDFPDVRFVAPAEITPTSSRARYVRKPLRAVTHRIGWGVAAALFLAVCVSTGMQVSTVSHQRTAVAEATAKLDDLERLRNEATSTYAGRIKAARVEVQKAQSDFLAAQTTLAAKYGEAQRELASKQLNFVISGPRAVQAGAPAEYRIETRDPSGRAAPAVVSYLIKDQAGKVVSDKTSLKTDGEVTVKLPPTLPLTPDRNLYLVVEAEKVGGAKAELSEQLQLAAPVYVTHLSSDKPMYQPGEVVRFRSLTVDRATLKPAEEPLNLQFAVRNPMGAETPVVAETSFALQPDGKPLLGPDGQPIRGIGAGEWQIPPTANGGEYTLAVKEANGRFSEAHRKFAVNQYQADRLNKVLEWSRKSFGPGDEVVANCKVTSASGPVANKPVSAKAVVDGHEFPVPCGPTSADGTAAVRFKLPQTVEKGEGSLTVGFTDGGAVEQLVKPIPIALKKLSVEFFAEGGDLVAGSTNRVYFQARTTLGKPADLMGRIVDETGRVVAHAETLTDAAEPGINQGMGRFEFTPEAKQTYRLLIDQPAGTEGIYKLPPVKTEGVILTALSEVSADPEPIRVRVACPSVGRTLLVGAYARGRLLDHRRITVSANGSADVELKSDSGIGGVTRVTVFEELPGVGPQKQLLPRAERLVYRKPSTSLALTCEPDKTRYIPGDHVTLSLKAANEKNEPVATIAMVGVVNKSVVTMADEKTFRTMPTYFLLTSEVQRPEDLEHADVLLGSHPKAAQALDLLLGTQGWRRFVEQNVPPPNGGRPDGEPVFLATANSPRVEASSYTLALQSVQEKYGPALSNAEAELTAAGRRVQRLTAEKSYADEDRRLSTEIGEARAAVRSAEADLAATLATRARAVRVVLPAACGILLAVALVALIVGLFRGFRYYVASAGALVVATVAALVLAVSTGAPEGSGQHVQLSDRGTQKAPASPKAARPEEAKPGLEQLVDELAQLRVRGEAAGDLSLAKDQPASQPLGDLTKARAALAVGAVPAPAGPAVPPAAAPAPRDAELRDGLDRNADDNVAFAKRALGVQNGAPKPAEPEYRRLAEEGQNKRENFALDLGRAGGRKQVDEKEAVLRGRLSGVKKDELLKAATLAPAAGINGGIGGGFGGSAQGGQQPAAGFPGMMYVPAGEGFGLGGFGNRGMDRRKSPSPLAPPFVVREYAHQHAPRSAGNRSDFAETVFWHPVLVLPKDGGKVSFDLSDEVTPYRVLIAAHTLDGRLGALESTIEARKPFSVEPKLPVEVTAGDRIDVPVTLANDTDAARSVTVAAQPKGLTLTQGSLEAKLSLAPQQSARRVFSFQPTIEEGTAELRLVGRCDPFGSDSVVRTVPVVPEGFPVIGSVSDVLEGTARHEITLPQTWVRGTLKCQVSVYPSTLAELQKGLEGLLREPGGCFEQTSTTNYPNALILEYLKESDQANPAAMKHAKELLERGYAKLTAFEVPEANKRQGFEWFGQFPPHEALTAYGLMQFRDMARVTDVDPQLLRRTRDYLLSRRDGKGGFTRNPQALDSFGRAPADVTNAYIVWALTESGKDDDVTKELNALAEQAKAGDDPYYLALVANSLMNRDRTDEATAILRKLAGKITKDGHLDGAKSSITGSSGRMLEIETTALAVLGWLKSNRPAEFTPAVRSAVAWIGKQRGGYGGFGSTQSTILALKALIAYTKANKKTPEAGELALAVGDRVLAKLAFAAGAQEALTVAIPDPERQLKPGKNDIRVEVTGKNSFPYTLTWSYQTLQPPSAEGCAVKLTAGLDRAELTEGDSTRLNVKLENVSHKGQGMAVAILGLPAGLKLPDDFVQLKDLAKPQENGTKPGRIGAFEVRGREVVLYWRDLAPDAVIDLSLDLRALVPGVYHGPASRAYLYYNPDMKSWTAPLAATIKAKG